MKPFNQNAAIRGAIRRIFARSPVIREVMMEVRKEFPKYNKDGSRAKKDAVCYLCNICKNYVGSTKVSVDHINPVISIEDGFIDWNEFVFRLWCDKTNLQTICDTCHQIKTNKERFERTYRKDSMFIDGLLCSLEYSNVISAEDLKALKKFTPKKLTKYPKEFVDKVLLLKKRNYDIL